MRIMYNHSILDWVKRQFTKVPVEKAIRTFIYTSGILCVWGLWLFLESVTSTPDSVDLTPLGFAALMAGAMFFGMGTFRAVHAKVTYEGARDRAIEERASAEAALARAEAALVRAGEILDLTEPKSIKPIPGVPATVEEARKILEELRGPDAP